MGICFFNYNVNCNSDESAERGKCEYCGFNPAVAPRRKKEARDRANGIRKPAGLEADILRLKKRLVFDWPDDEDEE